MENPISNSYTLGLNNGHFLGQFAIRALTLLYGGGSDFVIFGPYHTFSESSSEFFPTLGAYSSTTVHPGENLKGEIGELD